MATEPKSTSAPQRSIRLGAGATIGKSGYVFHARNLFLSALAARAPQVAADLLKHEGRKLVASLYRAEGIHRSTPSVTEDLPSGGTQVSWLPREDAQLHPTAEPVRDAEKQLNVYVKQWQARFELRDPWFYNAARKTLNIAVMFPFIDDLIVEWEAELLQPCFDGNPIPLLLPYDDVYADFYEGKSEGRDERRVGGRVFKFTPPHRMINVPVYLDDLKHPAIVFDDGVLEDDGLIGTFDSRSETVDDAVERLLSCLKPGLRRALESIAAEDRSLNGALSPRTLRSTIAFDWLVRYQVLKQSKPFIARSIGKDRSHVGREINHGADLIGLTLRPESKRGRPRRKHANTKKIVR